MKIFLSCPGFLRLDFMEWLSCHYPDVVFTKFDKFADILVVSNFDEDIAHGLSSRFKNKPVKIIEKLRCGDIVISRFSKGWM